MTPLEIIKERKIVAIVRGLKPEYLLRLGHALAEGGIGLMEVTYNQREPESWKDTARVRPLRRNSGIAFWQARGRSSGRSRCA